jgi:hypothetical protein
MQWVMAAKPTCLTQKTAILLHLAQKAVLLRFSVLSVSVENFGYTLIHKFNRTQVCKIHV